MKIQIKTLLVFMLFKLSSCTEIEQFLGLSDEVDSSAVNPVGRQVKRKNNLSGEDNQAPKVAQVTAPYYSPMGKTDPFEPQPRKDKGIEASVLDYDLSSFTLIGVIKGRKFNKAMLQGPSPHNLAFIIQEGDKVGVKSAIVQRIEERSLVVREKIKGPDNKVYFIDHEIKMGDKKAGNQPSSFLTEE